MRKLGKIIFSRYTVCAVIIASEISLFISVLLIASDYFAAIFSVNLIICAISVIGLINKDVNPEYKVSWAVVILILPYVGATFYALFFRRRMTRRELRLAIKISSEIEEHGQSAENMESLLKTDALAAGRARSLLRDDPNSALFCATASEYFPSGEQFFESLIASLSAAEEYIFLEYFIIDDGVLWEKIHAILKEKAAQGLDVRLLYDDIGCMKTLPRRYDKVLLSEGISCRIFGKITPKVSTVHNNRDHRKIAVIDGKVAYTGGANIADEYVNLKERFGHWKDGGVAVKGAAALGFAQQFLCLWAYNKQDAAEAKMPPSRPEFNVGDGGYYIPFGTGPVPLYNSVGKNVFLNIINHAERYVFITTPYLIIDFDLTESLCQAAKRGVDVRIITPAKADKRIVKVMTKSSYPHLISSGVKIYEYSPGFIHEKLLVSDDLSAVVGSINFDYRSLAHHFEDALWMFRTPTVASVRDAFYDSLDKSQEIDIEGAKLGVREWLVRIFVKLFAPLL